MKNNTYKSNIIKIAMPIILSNLIGQLQMLIDRIFLGRLDVVYMSAVGNACAPMWTTISTVFSLATGSTIIISQAIGEENKKKAMDYMSSSFKFNNVLAFLLFLVWMFCGKLIYTLMGVSSSIIDTCVLYTRIYSPVFIFIGLGASAGTLLQVSNHTKPLLISGIVRSGTNIILDWAMIFGHLGFSPMGVMGAALATTIAEFIGAAVLFIHICISKHLEYRPNFKQIWESKLVFYINSIKKGLPTASEDFLWNFGNLILIRILNSINDIAAGIYTIIFSIEILPVVVFGSLGQAVLTLTGKETGKKDFVQYHRIIRTVLIWTSILSTVMLVSFLIFPDKLMGMFTKDTTIIANALVYLTIIGINLFPKSGNIIIGCGIRGYGDTKWMFFSQCFGTVWVISVASLFVFVFKWGITGVFAAIIADEGTRCIINWLRLKRIK